MIILETVKEQLEKHKQTLNIIKECLWHQRTYTWAKQFKTRNPGARFF